jgi:acyl carrier protein
MNPDLAAYIAEREDILAQVRGILIGDLGLERESDEIDPDTLLFGSGLGLDSVDALELSVCVYSRLGLSLGGKAEHRAALRTVNTLVDWIIEQREKGDGA